MRVSVVILNYLNWKDTLECVDSLLKQSHSGLEIIIVDNDSKNDSISKFLDRYADESNIHILESTVNEGFARGNNIGITYSLDKLKIKNVFVANNDTVFLDKNFFKELVEKPISNDVGVIGTRIIGSDGLNQNPFKARIDWKFLIHRYAMLKWNILRKAMGESKSALNRTLIKIYYKKKNRNNESGPEETERNIKAGNDSPLNLSMLHGSAIFFTENYLREIRGFYPKTFLYNEERILYMMLKKAKLKTEFREDIELFHKEDQSSALSFGNDSYKMKVFAYDSTAETIKAKAKTIKQLERITNTYKYQFREIKS